MPFGRWLSVAEPEGGAMSKVKIENLKGKKISKKDMKKTKGGMNTAGSILGAAALTGTKTQLSSISLNKTRVSGGLQASCA
jgi:hypothetical protein